LGSASITDPSISITPSFLAIASLSLQALQCRSCGGWMVSGYAHGIPSGTHHETGARHQRSILGDPGRVRHSDAAWPLVQRARAAYDSPPTLAVRQPRPRKHHLRSSSFRCPFVLTNARPTRAKGQRSERGRTRRGRTCQRAVRCAHSSRASNAAFIARVNSMSTDTSVSST
jgi:hypothetical protein